MLSVGTRVSETYRKGGVLSTGYRQLIRAVFFLVIFSALFIVPLALPSSGEGAQNAVASQESVAPSSTTTSMEITTTTVATTTSAPAPPKPVVHKTVVTVKKVTTTTKPKPTTTTLPPNVMSGQASWWDAGPGNCAMMKPPLGTIVHVTNVANGLSTTCRVSDRGPSVPGRIIDLDKGVFAQIGDTGSGVITVRVSW